MFREHVQIFVPTVNVTTSEEHEFHLAKETIRRDISDLFARVAAVIGTAPLEERLADLAKYNPMTPSRIPIVYVPKPDHSHNILAGIPYTGMLLGRLPQMTFIAPHEMAHIIFGKFNDALAEPVANLFVMRDSPRRQRGNLRRRSESGPKQDDDRIGLKFNQAVLLAVLELFHEGTPIVDARSIEDLFGHRPSYRLLANARYNFELGEKKQGAAQRTHDFLRQFIAIEYEGDFSRYPSLALDIPSVAEVTRIDDWMRRFGRTAISSRTMNPNESRGIIRNFHGLIDGALMGFLLTQGLPQGMPHERPDPEAARESIRKFLQFYYQPNRGLREYGYEDFAALENHIRETFAYRGKRLLREFAWYQFKDDLRQHDCYQPMAWNGTNCLQQGRHFDAGQAVSVFQEAIGESMQRRRFSGLHPITAAAIMAPTKEPIISLTQINGYAIGKNE